MSYPPPVPPAGGAAEAEMPEWKGRPADWLTLSLFVIVNGLVLWNSLTHDPFVGYDAGAHIDYARTISEGRLPSKEDSYESFSAPLSYVLPALFRAADTRLNDIPPGDADLRMARFWLLVNAAISVGLTLSLLRVCDRIRPGDPHLRLVALLLLGSLPVYYKSFAQARAEPLVAFLCLASLEAAMAWGGPGRSRAAGAVLLGLLTGLAILARQWNLPVALAIAAFLGLQVLRAKGRRLREAGWLALACAVTLVSGGWFYVHLDQTRGGLKEAFQKKPRSFSILNQKPSFYFATGGSTLFEKPFRPAFRNQLWPILYSETWGDYWGYFHVAGARLWSSGRWVPVQGEHLERVTPNEPRPGLWTNESRMLPYLGRVNRLALLPTILLGLGALYGLRALARSLTGPDGGPGERAIALLALAAWLSAAAYFWFLVSFPEVSGVHIKATYILHAFPLLAILAAGVMQEIRRWNARAYAVLVLMIVVVAIHNAPALVSRYSAFFLGAGG